MKKTFVSEYGAVNEKLAQWQNDNPDVIIDGLSGTNKVVEITYHRIKIKQ